MRRSGAKSYSPERAALSLTLRQSWLREDGHLAFGPHEVRGRLGHESIMVTGHSRFRRSAGRAERELWPPPWRVGKSALCRSGSMLIRLAAPTDKEALTDMRAALWSDTPREEHHRELEQTLAGRPQSTLPLVIFVAEENAQLVGFADVGLRSQADGCDPGRPVGFLEGGYVRPDHMGRGIGRALVERAEDWARRLGCTEFASDTWADNEASQRAHLALGFEVVDRCVNYRKSLVRQGQAELEVVSPSSQSVTGDEFTESYNQVIADYYDDAYRDLLAERGDIDFYAE